jgi:hypothetical protein
MKSFASTANRDEYYRDNTIAVDCIELHLITNQGNYLPIYLCNGGFDLEFQSPTAPTVGNIYQAQGDFIGFSSITEDFDIKVGKFTVYLSGLSNNYITYFRELDIEGQRVCLYKAFLNFGNDGTQPLSLAAAPILMFDGIIYNYSVTETAESCQITVDCSSLFADFERTNGRKTNNWSNWLFQGANFDKCFEKSGFVGQTEFKWGRV